MGVGGDGPGAADDQRARVDLGEAGVGVGAAQFQDASAGLDQVAEGRCAATAVRNHAGEDGAGCSASRREGAGRTLHGTIGVIRQCHIATEKEIHPVVVDGAVAKELDGVGECDGLEQTWEAVVCHRTKGATVEDDLGVGKRSSISHRDNDARVDGAGAGEVVGSIERHRAAAVGRGDGLCRHRVADGTELHAGGAGEQVGLGEAHVASTAAETVDAARARAERGAGIDLRAGGTEEQGLVGAEGVEIERGVETGHIQRHDAFIRSTIGLEGGGRQGAVVEHGDDAQSLKIALHRQATRTDVGAVGHTEDTAGTHRDGTGTEDVQGTDRVHGTLIDRDGTRVASRVATDVHGRTRVPFVQAAGAGQAAEQVQGDGGVESRRSAHSRGTKECHRIGGQGQDGRGAIRIGGVWVEDEVGQCGARSVRHDAGVHIHRDTVLVVGVGSAGIKGAAVQHHAGSRRVGIGRGAAQGILTCACA